MFVQETLFPYVVENAEEFLKDSWEVSSVQEAVKKLDGEKELDLAGATKAVKEFTDSNSENPGLKSLQGLIYESGYKKGSMKAQ